MARTNAMPRNVFAPNCIVNLSRNLSPDENGIIRLGKNHGIIYIWEGAVIKPGELSVVFGKTPEEAFNSSYNSSRDRGKITVHRLYIFDKDTVQNHFPINKRGYDRTLHERINYFHAGNSVAVPFFVDVNRIHDSNEEALHLFNPQDQTHWKIIDQLVKGFLDPGNKKKHDQSLKAQITPRGYQGPTLKELLESLTNNNRSLLHAFPGWGKSTMGLYAIVKLATDTKSFKKDEPLNVLVTSPIVDTLEGFVESAVANNYFDKKINVYTTDSILSLSHKGQKKLITRVNNAKGEINLFVLSVQGIRFADPDNLDQKKSYTVRTIRKRYEFLNKIELFAQICDERHKEYSGPRTSEVFGNIKARYTLDLTATPYNLLQNGLYTEQEVVCDSMLRALREKNNGNPAYAAFPRVSIVAIGPEKLVQDCPEFAKYYTSAEDWDPRKLFDRSGKGLVHHKALTDFFGKTIGRDATMSIKKNPMTIMNDPELSTEAKNTLMVVVPEGMNGINARDNADATVDLLNRDPQFSDYFAVTSYELTRNRKIKPKKAIENLREEHKKKIIIVTHRMMTTGSDVPPLGCIIMLDKMANPGEFEQLLGRMFRIYEGKDSVRCYIFCPNMSIGHLVYSMAKDAAQYETDPETAEREMYDCLPITMVGTTRTVLSYDDAYRGVLEETKRLMSGEYYTPFFFEKFPNLHDAIGGLEFLPLKGGQKDTQITNKNLAKVSRRKKTDDDKRLTAAEKRERKVWKETMAVLLNEAPMIGYSSSSKTVEEIFEATLAEELFGPENCHLMVTALEGCKDFSQAVNISYKEMMEGIIHLPFNEAHDRLFRNEPYKMKQGLVYVPSILAREMLSNSTIQKKYANTLRNGKEYVILVLNALSGSIPMAAKELYPKARIVCAEYFPYYISHLKGLGFNVFDLEGEVENLKKMKKEFDVVIGNPPYAGKAALHQQFFNHGFDLLKQKGILIFLQPATTYFNKKSKQKAPVLQMIDIVKTNECSVRIKHPTVFANAGIQNYLSVTMLKKKISKLPVIEEIEFTNGKCYKNVPLENISMTQIEPELYSSIRNKYQDYINKAGSLEDAISKKQGILKATLGKIRGTRPTDDDFYTFIPLMENRKAYGASKNTEFGVVIQSENEVDHVYSYLESYVARFGLAILKFSQNTANKEFAMVPLVDFSTTHTDTELYKMLHLTRKEITAIRNTIVPLYRR